jgi:hypothetical protein
MANDRRRVSLSDFVREFLKVALPDPGYITFGLHSFGTRKSGVEHFRNSEIFLKRAKCGTRGDALFRARDTSTYTRLFGIATFT